MINKARNHSSWTYDAFGESQKVTAFEHASGNVWLRWYVKRVRQTRSLGFAIRSHEGRILPEAVAKAEEAAKELVRELSREMGDQGPPPLTLGEGLAQYFGVHAKFEKWLRNKITKYGLQEFGPDATWDSLDPRTVAPKIWEAIFRDAPPGRHLRTAEVTVGGFYKVWVSLYEAGKIHRLVARPRKWRDKMEDAWKLKAGKHATKGTMAKHRRYSEDEFAQILRTLYSSDEIDSRAQLLYTLSWGHRAQQFARLTRRDVKLLSGGDIQVDIPSSRYKPAGLRILTHRQAAVLTRHLTEGFLADLEVAYQSGKLENYLLVPGGRLDRDRVSLVDAERKSDRRGLGKKWRRIEELAGVTHMKGRGAQGMRRTYSDYLKEKKLEPRERRLEQGWALSATEDGYLADPTSDDLRALRDFRQTIESWAMTWARREATGE